MMLKTLYKGPLRFCVQCKYYLPATGMGRCRVFPKKDPDAITTTSEIQNTTTYFDQYTTCIQARSVNMMCGPTAKYYTEHK